ncbi:major facilitator superfamily transport protein [Natronomonas pharaonis DSM 2160]|uniref:Major facilitator superfamily transport protein n=1 Tax=Natronomonas pharaonis (strain ATCC 35678 / DSM 2160 / CIP 103997 / JCM 8858 / NBRC 14720 / NCIMB 2260 / Gabara) TaxID=348780 RepID=A0A1U7ETU7_NATPD|nr:MFS transporter [Natronomonas pharaonis]CAI48356.1 major facilitator superfamily transport protein [Natronomonas pharaonis DSM 2160]
MGSGPTGLRGTGRQLLALERDVLVLSVAMFAFSLGFQMTSRYIPRYMSVLGAGAVAIGLFGAFGNLISALYPYPGGAVSDRIGSRTALTLFGLLSTAGFLIWLFADAFGTVVVPPVGTEREVFGREVVIGWLEPAVVPVGIFLGLVFAQAWKSFGLGATFAIVKQSVSPDQLATGFASTETFRRTAFLLGPLLAAGILAVFTFEVGFRIVLAVAAAFGLVATLAQHFLYDASEDTLGKSFAGVSAVVDDLRSMPSELRPLLVADTLVRFGNGMVYVFFIIVVTEFLEVGVSLPVVGRLSPDAYFGVLLAIEMLVALLIMLPVSRLSRRVGLKPVVAVGFAVYAIFPAVLIYAPDNAAVLALLFAVSGLRFAGLPAHKALIVGPAESGSGGRVTGSYYLVRNVVVIPSAAIGGAIYAVSPETAFLTATAIGLAGLVVFLAFGREFEAAVAG